MVTPCKMLAVRLLCLLWCFLFTCHVAKGANKSDFYALHNYLFSGDFYKKDIRPVDVSTEALFIYMELSLLALVDVNEKDQVLKTSARLEVSWSDGYLSWNPADYGNIETLMVPQQRVWLPDILLGNAVKKQDQLGYDELPVRLHYSGGIEWEPTVLLETSCDLEITYFPFDTQKCDVDFVTALSLKEEVDINIDKQTPITLDDYSEDGQWDLTGTAGENVGDENGKTKIRYSVKLSRRRTFYLIYIILPIFFLSMTASLIFILPVEEGEKTSTGITVLLAFAVYLTIVADLAPNTSLQVSILGLYLTVLLGITSLSLICCVFIIRVHYRDRARIVGPKTVTLVRILRKITFMTPPGGKNDHLNRNSVTPLGERAPNKNMNMENKEDRPHSPGSNSLPVFLEDRLTWQDVAATYDWSCFVLFTSFTILTTIVCMLALDIGGRINSD